MKRCEWATDDLNIKYHDEEWGKAVYDDNELFEFLVLEGAQAGLSWTTILKKRAGYSEVFYNYNIEKLVGLSDEELNSICTDDRIVRHKLKVYSVRSNAIAFKRIQEEFGSFSNYLWNYTDGKVVVNNPKSIEDVPVQTQLSERISKDLKKRGFKFVGPTIIYAYLQAVGVVDDHIVGCIAK